MSHENSETVRDSRGRWKNISGHTRKTLMRKHDYEAEDYSSAQEAVMAAVLRSKQYGESRQFLHGYDESERRERKPGRRGRTLLTQDK